MKTRIPANSTIPLELKITKNHTDRITGFTHYRIEPIFDMPIFHFIYLLTIFAKNAKKAFLTSQEHETEKS